MLKLKNTHVTAMKILLFQKISILITYQYLTNFFSGEKNHKYFIGYLRDDYKVKSIHMMLPKTSAYVKSYDGHTTWMYFLIDDDLLKTI